MLRQILFGIGLVSLTILLQSVITIVGLRTLDWLEARKHDFSHRHAVAVIVFFVLLMFVTVMIDVTIWAAFYYFAGVFADLEEALYFSASTFTTLGYGDIVPPKPWRIVCSFEAANGLMIFGWATAFVVAAIQHFNVWLSKKS